MLLISNLRHANLHLQTEKNRFCCIILEWTQNVQSWEGENLNE